MQLNGLHASFFYKITYCNLLHFLKVSILHIIAMLCIILSTALLPCIHIRTSLCTTLSTALGIHFSTCSLECRIQFGHGRVYGSQVLSLMGISQGSDDYLTKPFRPTILLMKVRALLRRVEMDRGKTTAAEDELRYGDLRCSATENAVFCGNTIVALTQTELRLLSYMLKQPEKAYSREELLSAVWGFDSEVETRVTDETLRRIRKKLLQAGSTVSVSTIWGFGYKLKGAECT